MELRTFKPEDHPTAVQWWSAQGWPPVPLDCLPPTGLVVEGLCMGFVYKCDGSTMGIMEWVVGNPTADKVERALALDVLIDGLEKLSRELGVKYVFTYTKNERLLNRYKKHGFGETDKNMTHLVKNIWQR